MFCCCSFLFLDLWYEKMVNVSCVPVTLCINTKCESKKKLNGKDNKQTKKTTYYQAAPKSTVYFLARGTFMEQQVPQHWWHLQSVTRISGRPTVGYYLLSLSVSLPVCLSICFPFFHARSLACLMGVYLLHA